MSKRDEKRGKAKCPRCHEYKNTRVVPTERGYDPSLVHWVCDGCKIGWYMKAGSRPETFMSRYSPEALKMIYETMKNSYVPEGRPVKKPAARK